MTTKTEVISLRLGSELIEAVRAIAKREDMPVSFVIRRALKQGLTASGLMVKNDSDTLPDWD